MPQKKIKVTAVCLDLPGDLESPVSIFLKLAGNKQHAFLLESVELGERLGRFSLIGMDPEIIVEHQDGETLIQKNGGGAKKSEIKKNLLGNLENLLSQYQFHTETKLPSLVGGFVGYIGYELVQEFEDVKLKRKPGLKLPDAVFMFPTNLVVFDHIKHQLKLIHLVIGNMSPKEAHKKAEPELNKLRDRLQSDVPNIQSNRKNKSIFKSHITKSTYESMVRKAKEHIRAGDCIQIVPSQRFSLGTVENDFLLFRALRSVNPSPYMFYLKHKNMSLVGSSPEMLSKKAGRVAEIRPIAGTRPRGKNEKEDQAYEQALRASKKEIAEHVMLVDLGRNDLGRVCDDKSVKVEDFARVERYSHVMHLVSDIKATLKKDKTSFDLLRASFPAGTVTGAPKIRAMQIIDDLEKEKRGPYAGSFGYFGLSGDMDMCITIRTIVIQNKQAYVQAGAGIVNDSVPSKEYQETINKAKALLKAVEKASGL